MTLLQWICALMPVLSVAVLLVLLRMPASRAMPLALVLTILLTLTVWGVPAQYVSAAVLEGLIIAGSVVLIVLGALAFLGAMRASGGLGLVRLHVLRLTPDSRVHLLFIGWLLVCFIEGAAGFGTPPTVAAPLLIALGFPALAAISLSLIGGASATTFGAVGTPIVVGLATGTGRSFADPADAAFLTSAALTDAAIDIVVGITLPVLLMLYTTRWLAEKPSRRAFYEILPLAVVSALAYSVPAFLWVRLLGVEFGAILGGATGLVILFLIVRLRVPGLMPRNPWSVSTGYLDPGELEMLVTESEAEAARAHLSPLRVWAPYLLLTLLLLCTRVIPPVKEALTNWSLGINDILGTSISTEFQPLYSPGVVFLIVAAATVWIQRVPREQITPTLRSTGTAVLGSAMVLAAAVPIVRVFLNSGENTRGLHAMPLELAEVAASGVGVAWPLVAPWVGALGSFVSGSATFSHLMFGSLQEHVANTVGADPIVVLAAQIGGANAGNMICVANIVAVAAICGLLGREGDVIRSTLLPMVVYTTLYGLIGMVLA